MLSIVGDAGRGKSRLIYEFQNWLNRDDVTYLESQCVAYGRNIPYAPIIELAEKELQGVRRG